MSNIENYKGEKLWQRKRMKLLFAQVQQNT